MVVLSRNAVEIPKSIAKTVSSSSETPGNLVVRLSSQGATHLYIDGGITIQRFLNAGLIDELTITLIPVLLGEGKPLFGPLENDIALTHISTKAYDFGFVQMRYRVARMHNYRSSGRVGIAATHSSPVAARRSPNRR